jgi:glutathione S-transferase
VRRRCGAREVRLTAAAGSVRVGRWRARPDRREDLGMELYYAPLACSLAARIVAGDAGVPLVLRQVEVFAKTLTETGAGYREVAPFALVPALRLDDGALLTEVAAIVQYLADLRPERGLAPAWGTRERYQLIEWLSFTGTELHKKVVWPLYNRGVPEAALGFARQIAPRVLDHVARHLEAREFVVGDRFTAADAYLWWALHLARLAGLDTGALRDYLRRIRERPVVAALLAEEAPAATAALARQ